MKIKLQDNMLGHKERGRRVTTSGNVLENWFQGFLKRTGFKMYKGTFEEFKKEMPKLEGNYYMRHVDVGISESGAYAVNRNISRGEGLQYADFILSGVKGYKKGLRIECKRQDSKGSADEKLDYTVANIQRAEIPAWIGWVGKGWMNGAIERTEAKVKTNKYLKGVHEMEVVKTKLKSLI